MMRTQEHQGPRSNAVLILYDEMEDVESGPEETEQRSVAATRGNGASVRADSPQRRSLDDLHVGALASATTRRGLNRADSEQR
jgi:hypothetical protein